MAKTQSIQIGSKTVIALTDGATQFDNTIVTGTSDAEIAQLLKTGGHAGIETNFNAFVVQDWDRTTLIDTGAGGNFGDAAGQLPAAMAEIGVAPNDITHIILTHMHPDHFGGLVDADGAAVFQNAQITLSAREYDFWRTATNFTTADETVQQWQSMATSIFNLYSNRLDPVAVDADLGQGLSLIDLPGHTPGHVGVRVSDGAESLVIAGDIVHAQTLQIANPEIGVVFDVDGDQARVSRKAMLRELAAEQTIFSGCHLLEPKFGRIVEEGAGYLFEPSD